MLDKLFNVLFVGLAGLMLYIFFVIVSVSMWGDSKCLERGYPRTSTTFTLEVYCIKNDELGASKVERIR